MPNGIRIHSGVFPQSTGQTDGPTDRPTDGPREWSVSTGRYRCTADTNARPNNNDDDDDH